MAADNSSKTVLVTGGGGFLGSRIVRLLLERGYSVRSFSRSAQPQNEALGVQVIRGDLGDAKSVSAAVKGCDGVFHVAAKAGIWGSYQSFYEANVTGTRNVLAACREHGVGRLVYTSTPSVVFSGEPFEGADESLPLQPDNPISPYAATKAIAEAEVLAACAAVLAVKAPAGSSGVSLATHSRQVAQSAADEAKGSALQDAATGSLRACALRPHLIYGHGDPHLLPRLCARARSGRLRQVGSGSNRVDLTHVDNAARAHLQAFDALGQPNSLVNGRAYFLSDGEPVNLWTWIGEYLRREGIEPPRKRIGAGSAYRIGAVCEWVWRRFRLGGEPPMTRFVATELAKSHWFSIAAARRDFGYDPRPGEY